LQSKSQAKAERMGRDPIWSLIARFSTPAIISMTVGSTYNLVDTAFVGHLGPYPLSALVIVFPMMIFFMALAIGTSVGASSLIARRLGAGDHEGADRVACTTITLVVIISILITAICLPNLDGILRLIGAKGVVLSLARKYMAILVIFYFFNMFALTIGGVIRAQGAPTFPSVVLIVSALTNIALDPIFIYALDMGVQGAAVATAIARGIGTLMLILYFVMGKTTFRFKLNYFMPNIRTVFEIYRIGLASIVRMTGTAIALTVSNKIAYDFDPIALNVFGVIMRTFSVVIMPVVGLGQGTLPLIGYNYGAKKLERVGDVVSKSARVALIWGIICALIAFIIPRQVMTMFGSDEEFLALGTAGLRIAGIGIIALTLQIALTNFFQGIGKGIASLILTSTPDLLLWLPGVVILTTIFGQDGLWMVFPVVDTLAVTFTIIWLTITFRRLGMKFRFRYGKQAASTPIEP
jgi:putative MATE family efflux protein